MTIIALFVSTSLIFLVLDAAMLTIVLRPLFERHLGEALLEAPRLAPAVLFYLLYMGGILYFVSLPALRDNAPVSALLNGALLGLLAYGTYELSNHAVMRDWHPGMVVTDMAWGAVLTGLSAWGGVMIARAVQ